MSPWQTPNFSSTTMAKSLSDFTTQWQQAITKWQTGMEGIASTPASFWQSVASIQSAQTRAVAEFYQRQPAHLSNLLQCKSLPQLVECLSRWNGHNLTAAINLGMVMQAHRGNLLLQWQRQFPLNSTSATALANMWKSGLNTTQTAGATANQTSNFSQASGSATPSSQATAPTATQSATAGTVSASNTSSTAQTNNTQQAASSANSSSPLVQATTSSTQAARAQSQAASTESNGQLALLNGTTGTAIVSSTANSVMRSASGSTIASAAARRSVVARRTSNNRRRAPR